MHCKWWIFVINFGAPWVNQRPTIFLGVFQLVHVLAAGKTRSFILSCGRLRFKRSGELWKITTWQVWKIIWYIVHSKLLGFRGWSFEHFMACKLSIAPLLWDFLVYGFWNLEEEMLFLLHCLEDVNLPGTCWTKVWEYPAEKLKKPFMCWFIWNFLRLPLALGGKACWLFLIYHGKLHSDLDLSWF